jgi:hypothetical protein
MSAIRAVLGREWAWFRAPITTHRWRIITALTLGAIDGNLDAHGAPWYAFFGILLLALGVIIWPSMWAGPQDQTPPQ